MRFCCTILSLSAHTNNMAGSTHIFRAINKSPVLVVQPLKTLQLKQWDPDTSDSTGEFIISISKSKVDDPRAPFSIATTPMYGGGTTHFLGLLYFTLDMYHEILSVKQGGIKYHFLSL